MLNKILLATFSLILMSCATTPVFDRSKVDFSLTPQRVITEPAQSLNKTALWGGTILSINNLQSSTQIEMLAYPLNSSYRPMLDDKPLGRFIILKNGFLEPSNFSQGRLLTVMGTVSHGQSGYIGQSSYNYPVINAQQLQLWSVQRDVPKSRFSFGLGIRL